MRKGSFKQRLKAVPREKSTEIPHDLWAEWCVLNDFIFECGQATFKGRWTSAENTHRIDTLEVSVCFINNSYLEIRVEDIEKADDALCLMTIRWRGHEYLKDTLMAVMNCVIPHVVIKMNK